MKREIKPNNDVVLYDNKINNEINLAQLSSIEINVIESIFSTLKDKGSSEIITSFSDFRKMAKIAPTYFKDSELQGLIESTLNNLSNGSITVKTKDYWTKFAIFEMLFVDNKNRQIKYKVSNPFIQYFNAVQGGYTLFPLIDLVTLKSKYSKLIYLQLIRFRSTGIFETDYDHFMYDILGAPETLKKGGKANSVVLYPALDELSDKKLFYNLDVDFKKDRKNRHHTSRIRITFDPTTYSPEENTNIPTKYNDPELEKAFDERLDELGYTKEEVIRIAKTPWIGEDISSSLDSKKDSKESKKEIINKNNLENLNKSEIKDLPDDDLPF